MKFHPKRKDHVFFSKKNLKAQASWDSTMPEAAASQGPTPGAWVPPSLETQGDGSNRGLVGSEMRFETLEYLFQKGHDKVNYTFKVNDILSITFKIYVFG